jgi:hypothetical protein
MPSLNTGNAILSNAIAVDSSYNVGIGGAASGTNKLQVTGIASANSFIPTSSTIPSNGMYLSAANTLNFATNTTNRLTISSSGIVGIAATPSAWGDFKVLEFANGIYLGTYTPAGQTMYLGANNYFNGSDFIYKVSGYATRYQQASGAHQWFVSTISGTAGNVASFNQAMTITSAGNVGIGANPSSFGGYLNTTLQATGASGVNLDFRTSGGTREGVLLLSSGTEFSLIAATAIPLTFRTSDTERMRITSGGNVGIGTSSPSAKLQVLTSGTGIAQFGSESANGGWIRFTRSTSTVFGYLGSGIELVTGGGANDFALTAESSNILFATSGGNERMRITSGGNVGIGTTSPNYPISVKQNVNANAVIYGINEFTNGWGVYIQKKSSDTGGYFFVGDNQTANKILIYGTGNVENTNGSYGTIASDRRLKENIVDATSKLEDILKLRVVNFNLIGETQKNIGFIAQEMQDVFPSLVNIKDTRKYDEDGNIISGYEDALGLKVGMEFAILVKAIQELNQKVENQQQTINSLINR